MKILKILVSVALSVFVISFSVVPCFADQPMLYGAMLSHSNVSSMSWRVNYDVRVTFPSGQGTMLNLDYTFSPVFPNDASDVYRATDSFLTELAVEYDYNDYLYTDYIQWNHGSIYVYDTSNVLPSIGYLVDVTTDNNINSESNTLVGDLTFNTGDFYYTYSPDMVAPDIPYSPFVFVFFDEDITSHLSVTYSPLGSQEVFNWSGDFGTEIALLPSMFDYTDEDSFTVYIHSLYFEVDTSSYDLHYEYGYYPDFIVDQRDLDLRNSVIRPSDEVFRDYTSWIGTAVSGFMNFQIFEGFSFGSLLMVIISFSVVMWFLKLFAGG